MTQLIGITGKARAGKDSFANALVQCGYQRVAFADALKLATAVIANEPIHLFFDEVTKEYHTDALGMTRRKALQAVGKAVRDSLGEHVWVNRALANWKSQGKPLTVVTDVRYPNEADAVRALGGIIIRINRDGSGLDGDLGAHESERRLSDDLVDIEVFNDGTVGELHAEARKIFGSLFIAEAAAIAEHRESEL